MLQKIDIKTYIHVRTCIQISYIMFKRFLIGECVIPLCIVMWIFTIRQYDPQECISVLSILDFSFHVVVYAFCIYTKNNRIINERLKNVYVFLRYVAKDKCQSLYCRMPRKYCVLLWSDATCARISCPKEDYYSSVLISYIAPAKPTFETRSLVVF